MRNGWWLLALSGGCVVVEDQSFAVEEEVRGVDIRFENGDIRVVGTGEGYVSVEMEVGGLGFGEVGHYVTGGVLYIDGDCGALSLCGGEVTVYVPSQVGLDVELGAGDVEVEGLSGPLFSSVGAGDFHAASLGGPKAVVLLGAGDVSMTLLEPFEELYVELGAGSADLEVPAGSYDLDIDAGAGEVDLEGVAHDSGAASSITAWTDAGEISITGF